VSAATNCVSANAICETEIRLTKYERGILDSVENDEWRRITDFENQAARYREAAKATRRHQDDDEKRSSLQSFFGVLKDSPLANKATDEELREVLAEERRKRYEDID